MNKGRFTDQVAIVTGAGVGIGYEIALQLALEGAAVLVNDVDTGLAERATKQIQQAGGRSLAFGADASQTDKIDQMVALAIEQFGRLDIAVANAGITTFGSFLEYKEAEFQRLIAVNLQGSYFLAQRATQAMIRQQSGGSILFMSSVTGHQAHPQLSAYGMSKAALEMLAKGLSVELAEHGIRVNCVAPGATLTERTEEDPDYRAEWSRITPSGRPCTPADIAEAALFLLSPQARQITGQALIVDGGWTSVSPPPEL
ncbi:MAG: SDR family oxidoreductase [Bacteroidota bacterium]